MPNTASVLLLRVVYTQYSMKYVLRLGGSAIALLIVSYLVPGISIDTFWTAVIAALFLGILNMLVRPTLVVLTIPITVVTLGLFIFFINAGIFLFVASFVDGFVVLGIWNALLGSILVSILSSVIHRLT